VDEEMSRDIARIERAILMGMSCPFRRCRPPIPPSRSQIPGDADHLGGAEVHRGAGCGG